MKTNYLDILKSHKMKITNARVAILESFAHCDKPQSVEMIEREIGDKSINQVTIYRTIESFLKVGILGRVDLRQDSVYYELLEDHHHHIVCTKCGTIEDFESCRIEDVSKDILCSSKKFKTITDHSFELFGICHSCSKKKNI